ncbi:tRNA (N(6)-L-threonylcarbamoyladenosine(37)-C(2))-methylthiotran sferase MtaB [Sulfidibacter corallicola]|uniref:tRNA (N(6)-L-threonylcarbamoyladenosine(37)-C(2))-methylthiotransferase MtaB n=1 Tax=Sulfidibacter corallicola TaxID=2818388 RepID=A0A8A4TLK7_SULCO|nr:tRNA (N(6)-L-threonylcarbamoyladenosine(37)-C(2))-methylthiotransferase MtaB [Sulfidibacter corallicola]QTD49771.1 tRNA (N(6)-L-threonylcarbamoyladenosine(37)-C(2))-methylthiotransferase MtaB [Sulfidibacter corallicola]
MSEQVQPTFAFHTMGCKLNYYDSEVMASELQGAGFSRCREWMDADLVILNTCTVTNKSDAESRNLIRKFRKNNPNGFLVVTGCYAQAKTDDLRAMEEIDLVTTNVDKYNVAPIVSAYRGAGRVSEEPHDIMEKRPAEFRLLDRFEAKTRAFVKIQDGCNLRCAYCIIPYVRGNNRSIPIPDVLSQFRLLAENGIREVVLTGIHIGTWGRDFRPRKHVTDLLRAFEETDLDLWVRISSLDSPEIPDEMIDLIAASERIVPHLHIPLQAGDDRTLRRMRRIYKTGQYRDRVEKLREAMPDICLGADVIVGFPGETEEEFESTVAFLESIPMDYLHVFPYSNRTGTAASKFGEQVNGRISRNRGRLLREFSERRKREHYARHVGQTRQAIVVNKPLGGRTRSALTDNYIEVPLDAPESLVGQRVEVTIGKEVLNRWDAPIPWAV